MTATVEAPRLDPWHTLVMVSAWRCVGRPEGPLGACWEVSGDWCAWCPSCAATVATAAAVAGIVADSIEAVEADDIEAAWALAELAWCDPRGAALHLDLWPVAR